ncbi:MAG: hypothetical protein NZ108_03225, partial [Bacteroidia bacterium]|nr:hypothetical protein [Bacteroidia bacterium]
LLTIFPRTYFLQWNGFQLKPTRFYYGTLLTHHAIGDFNQDGIQEFGLGNGESVYFFQMKPSGEQPNPVTRLRGFPIGSQSGILTWNSVDDAEYYRVWRIDFELQTAFLLTETQDTSLQIDTLISGKRYFFAVTVLAFSFPRPESDFSNLANILPHSPAKLLSATYQEPANIRLVFDTPVQDSETDIGKFKLPNRLIRSIARGGEKSLLLTLNIPLLPGNYTIAIDSSFRDAWNGTLDPSWRTAPFTVLPINQAFLYLERWQKVNSRVAELQFNEALTNAAINPQNWEIHPFGRISNLSFVDSQTIRVEVADVLLGGVGYSVGLRVRNLVSVNGNPQRSNEGDAVIFEESGESASDAYVYPNPVRKQHITQGLTFANLPRNSIIHILKVDGTHIQRLVETEGDGGIQWDMRDKGGNRIAPGVYLYWIEVPGKETVKKQFVVAE